MSYLNEMPKRNRNALIVLWVLTFFFLVNFVTPSIFAYIARTYSDLDFTRIVELSTIPNLIGVAVSFLIGPIAMKVNKKWLIAGVPIAICVYLTIFAVFGVKGPFWMLIVAAVIAGYPQGSVTVLGLLGVGSLVKTEDRPKAYSVVLAMQNGGLFVWLNIFGRLAARNDGFTWNEAYWVMAALIVPAIILFIVLYPKEAGEPDKVVESESGSVEKVGVFQAIKGLPAIVVFFCILQMFYYTGNQAYTQNISVLLITDLALGTSAQSGLAISFLRLASTGVALLFPFTNKVFKNYQLILGYGLNCLAMVLTATASSLLPLYIAAALSGYGNTLAYNIIYNHAVTRSGKSGPVAVSLMQGCVNLGTFVTVYFQSWISTQLFGAVTATGRVWAGALIIGVSIAIALFTFPRDVKNFENQQAIATE